MLADHIDIEFGFYDDLHYYPIIDDDVTTKIIVLKSLNGLFPILYSGQLDICKEQYECAYTILIGS